MINFRKKSLKIITLFFAISLFFVSNPTALAHAALLNSNPKNDSKLTTLPEKIILNYSENIREDFLRVSVLNPENIKIIKGSPTIKEKQIIIDVMPQRINGKYRVGFSLTSQDGHPVNGQISFIVDNPEYRDAIISSPTDKKNPSPKSSTSKISTIIIFLIALIVIALIIAYYSNKKRK